MSAKLLGLAFDADMGSPIRKLVLLKLVDTCRDDGTRIFPGVPAIAAAAQCSTRQVMRELAAFVDVGLLAIIEQGGGRSKATEYSLSVTVLQTLAMAGWKGWRERHGNHDTVSGYSEEAVGEAAENHDTGVSVSETVTPSQGLVGETVTPATGNHDKLSHPIPYRDPLEDLSPLPPLGQNEGERENSVPDRELLEQAMRLHPTSPHDDRWSIETAWRGLTPAERRAAVEWLPAWLNDAKARKRNHVLGLPAYLAQKRWVVLAERIAGAPKPAAPSDGRISVKVFSRTWWWLFWRALGQGKRDEAKRIVKLGQLTGSVLVAVEEHPSKAAEETLSLIGRQESAWREWQSWTFRHFEIMPPTPDVAIMVWAPGVEPPRDDEQLWDFSEEKAA